MPLLPLVRILIAVSAPPLSGPAATAALDHAVRQFETFDDVKAATELHALLMRSPPASVAAKAHIYLGLIALNQTDSESAKAEFMNAVAADVVVDLPIGQSPKAEILFAEARRAIASGPLAKGAPSTAFLHEAGDGAAPAAAPVPAAAEATLAPAPSRVPAYVVGGIGVAALVAGGIFGFLQQQAKSSVGSDLSLSAAQSDAQPYAQDGIAADVLFGVGGAALVTAVILFFTEGSSSSTAVAVGAGPNGVALSGRF